jgi:hypothetical protein
MVFCYRRFGTIYRSYNQEWSSSGRFCSNLEGSSGIAWHLKMGPIGCPETSVTKCRYTVFKTPEERRAHLHCSGSLTSKSRDFIFVRRNQVVKTSVLELSVRQNLMKHSGADSSVKMWRFSDVSGNNSRNVGKPHLDAGVCSRECPCHDFLSPFLSLP